MYTRIERGKSLTLPSNRPPHNRPTTEQLEIVQRMHRSYRFLQAQNFGIMSGITG
jgi:hypothetical protein